MTNNSVFGFNLGENLHSSASCRVSRAVRESDGLATIVKLFANASPGNRQICRREYSLLERLRGAAVPRVITMLEDGSSCGYATEDGGGTSLDKLQLEGGLPLQEGLALGERVARALGTLHERDLIHRRVAPSNIVWNRSTGDVVFIDFAAATFASETSPGSVPPPLAPNLLRYASPEECRGANHEVSFLSDYYSLGICLYELIAGVPPFSSEEPLELAHLHITQPPPRIEDIPSRVNRLLLRLLAKQPLERIPSMEVLLRELSICRDLDPDSVTAGGDRALATSLLSTDQLIAREAHVSQFCESFLPLTESGARLLRLIGEPGSGKTALVMQSFRPIATDTGYFGRGKFGQDQERVSADPLSQVLRAVCRSILTEPESNIEEWRRELSTVTGPCFAALSQRVPELAFLAAVTGHTVVETPERDAERCDEAMVDFVLALASRGKPLCLFFDDLQWADEPSLHILRELLHAARDLPVMLITAERSDGGRRDPRIERWICELAEQGSAVADMAVGNLELGDTKAYLAGMLGPCAHDPAQLAEEVQSRTNGNPLFVRTFLQSLHTSGQLRPGPNGWLWDIAQIRREAVTENVVTLLQQQLALLPKSCRNALAIAACIGTRFSLRRFVAVAPNSSVAELGAAFSQRFLFSSTELHSSAALSDATQSTEIWFAHDRVQQAVLETLSETERREIHGRIGHLLLEAGSARSSGEELFATVRHLNAAIEPTHPTSDAEHLAGLNLTASQAALKMGATHAALEYAEFALKLLCGEGTWSNHYELMRDLHISAVRAAHASMQRRRAVELGNALRCACHRPSEWATISPLLGNLALDEGRPEEALEIWLRPLSDLGFDIPREPSAEQADAIMRDVQGRLSKVDTALQWCALACTDEGVKDAFRILNAAIFGTFYHIQAPHLLRVLAATLLLKSLDRGLTEHCAPGYVYYACLLANAGQRAQAMEYGHLANRIARRFQDSAVLAHTLSYSCFQLIHWTASAQELSHRYLEGYRAAQDAGSVLDIANLASSYCIHRFLAGDPLGPLLNDMDGYAKAIVRVRQDVMGVWLAAFRQAVRNLACEESAPALLRGDFFDEREPTNVRLTEEHLPTRFNLTHAKAWLAVIFEEPLAVIPALRQCESFYESVIENSGWGGNWAFVASLACYAALSKLDVAAREAALSRIRRYRVRLEEGARHNPKEYRHRLMLLDAEHARGMGEEDASARYLQAVELARQSALLHEHAIACEFAGRYALEREDREAARSHLREALECYVRWGAHNKVRELEHRYGVLMPRVSAGRLSTEALSRLYEGDVRFGLLDLAGVLGSLMVISQELDPQQLLVRLLELLVETAGAERGLFVLERGDEWAIVARWDSGNAELIGMPLSSAEAEQFAPLRLLRYVIRTHEPMLLSNASNHPDFGADPYVVQRSVKSAVCFPMAQQARQRSVIYLENSLVSGAFTNNRLTILSMLSAQAAISLENAELYETLERRVRSRTEELAKKNKETEDALARLKNAQSRMIMQDRMASLGSMTAGIAHELRNPLNFIVNFAKISRNQVRTLLDSEEREPATNGRGKSFRLIATNLDRIVEHSARIEGIVSSILQHCRGGSREPRATDINYVVQTYVNLAKGGTRSANAPHQVHIEVILDDSVPKLNVVPDEIGRVLLNLIDNASYSLTRKVESGAPAEWKPRIVVSTRVKEGFVEIRVWDNGTGVPLEIRDKIFTPFYSTKPSGVGTGLGLSISRDIIVDAIGGSMRLESEEDQFAEFAIELPTAKLGAT